MSAHDIAARATELARRAPGIAPDIIAARAVEGTGGDAEYAIALEAARTARLGPPVERNNLAGLRLAARDGEVVPATSLIDDDEDDGDAFASMAGPFMQAALDAGHHDLAAAVRRAQAGMDRQHGSSISATPYTWTDPATIPPRPWVFGHWLLRKTAAAVIAPGGTGKSTFTAALALSIATGRPLLGKKVHDGPGRVWIWNLEDPIDEMARGIQAAAKHFGIKPNELDGRLFVDSGMEGSTLCTATESSAGFQLLRPVFEEITGELLARRIDVLVIDPFVSSHAIDEIDNTKIDKIAKEWARVANAANCVVVLVHHTSKSGADSVNVMSARGGKSLTDAVRSALVFNRMDANAALRFGFDDAERRRYFTVSDDKHNRAAAEGADWFKLESVDLGNGAGDLRPGDSVGVATPWHPPALAEGVSPDDLGAVHAAIAGGEWRKDPQCNNWVGFAIGSALGIEIGAPAGRRRVKALLASWLEDGSLIEVEHLDSSRKTRKFVEVA